MNRPTPRTWTERDGTWRATLDRVELQCGACDPGVWLHVTAPDGTRYTVELEEPLPLERMSEAELRRLAAEVRDAAA